MDAAPEPRLTISQIDRLGRRLRASATVSPDDLATLQRLQGEHLALLDEVQEILRARLPRVLPSGRLKTWQTIVEKLKRERTMALSRMQDIVGTRIVEDMTRVEQDVLVAEIGEALVDVGQVQTIDRRLRPSFGYRAVHLVVDHDRRLVEVQVRTKMQDDWAQVVERLGDDWGRQIRYGEPPDNPDTYVGRGALTRRQLWEVIGQMSEALNGLESAIAESVRRGEQAADDPSNVRAQFADGLATLRQVIDTRRLDA